MMFEHHNLDVHPVPRERKPLFINEPWMVDRSIFREAPVDYEPDADEDNVQIYVPIDINRNSILRRLDYVINKYGAASEENEMDFELDIWQIVSQLEVYDQIWFVRNYQPDRKHSVKACEIVEEMIARLEEIPVDDAETFPYQMIRELREEFLS